MNDHDGAAERNLNVLVLHRDKLGISTMAETERLEADGFASRHHESLGTSIGFDDEIECAVGQQARLKQ